MTRRVCHLKILSKHMTCHAPSLLRTFGYGMMTNAPNHGPARCFQPTRVCPERHRRRKTCVTAVGSDAQKVPPAAGVEHPCGRGRTAAPRQVAPLAVATLSVRLSTSATIAVFEGPHRHRIRQPQHSRKALCSSRTTIEPRYTQPPPSAARETTRTSGKVCIASVRAR
jgi:hypothetical protein